MEQRFFYIIYNKQNKTRMLGNIKVISRVDKDADSFGSVTREISSWSTLDINSIFPHIHVLFSIHVYHYFI